MLNFVVLFSSEQEKDVRLLILLVKRCSSTNIISKKMYIY